MLALTMYATELSRAAGVAIAPFALCLIGAAFLARKRGYWQARRWMVIFGTLALAALVYGIWLYAYGQMHPPTPF